MAIPGVPLPQATTEALPRPYNQEPVSPVMYGAEIAEGAEKAARGADIFQAKDDALAAREAETAFIRETTLKITGYTDPQTGERVKGFRDLKGELAAAGSVQATEEIRNRQLQYASQLKNQRQRDVFMARTDEHYLGAVRAIETHVSEERQHLNELGLRNNLIAIGQ